MSAITIEEAQTKLPDLIHKLIPGEEVLIVEKDQPVAKLIGARAKPPRKLGSLRGTVRFMAPDFDAPLIDFKEYMQ
jgi:antitoxin (DNA-binding transcriptional repressor) of toxin-antitoxin stability system